MNVFDKSKHTLQAGMVISVEPPVFIHPEHIGARLIDCMIVTENGAEILSKRPRDLIVI
jgi:Xaa-Pro aminopeptidase